MVHLGEETGDMDFDFESAVRRTGLWLYQLLEEESPSVFRKDFWIGKVLDWAMQDEAFKVQMFRFVDVFPYLTRSSSIARHMQEYFTQPGLNVPSSLQWGIKFVSPTSLAAKVLAKTASSNISSMAKNFIVGETPQEALPILEKLRERGMGFTIDLLGEAVVSEKEAEEYLGRYLELFDFLHEAQKGWHALGMTLSDLDWGFSPKVNISVKTSAMYSQMNPCAFDYSVDKAKERLRPVFRKALETGAFVILDMEHYGIKDLTLSLYRSLMEEVEFKNYPHTGIVIQAYLRESEADLRQMISWAQSRKTHITIRLVKGAYWDSEVIWAQQKNWPVPVFTNKYETDANFEKLARIILQNHQWISLACASHNIRSIAYVLETAKQLKVPSDRLEYQVLYGMGEPVRNALRNARLPLRLYTPVGDMFQGMSYLVRRLLENTANESFLRKSFAEGVPKEELLRNPLELLRTESISTGPSGVMAEAPLSGPAGLPPTPAALAGEVGEPVPTVPCFVSEPDIFGSIGPFQNEPVFDWNVPENRQRFREALNALRKRMPLKVPLVVQGKKLTTKHRILSTNPNAPEEVVGEVASAGLEEAKRAVHSARASFPAWRDTDPGKRAEYLFKAAEIARKMRYELAALQVFEVGKGWSEADADVCEAIDFLEYYGREMLRLSVPRPMGNVPGENSQLFYEPRGVGVVIAPWNFPMAISVGMTSAALVTGNTVIYKPASQSPVVGSMVYRIFEEARLPAGVLNFLPGPGGEIGDFLVSHPDVALIAFTGSKDVGLHIIELASKTNQDAHCVKNVIAEMGGKNAIIIDSDADLDEAIVHVLYSAFGYQGQKCSACSRLIVLEENYEKLLERLKAAAESLELGPPEDPKNFMGAVVEARAMEKILSYIEIGKREGKLLLQREIPGGRGHAVPLTIFTDVAPDARIAQEEIFGPVLSIIKVKDFDEALRVANATQYALTGGVFSRSPWNIQRARREFRTGNLYINRGCTGAIVGRHPFGGFKLSGVGSKAGGPDYLLQFMVPRNIVENTLRRGVAPLEE